MTDVADTTEDARFADHPIVRGGPRIRFYAGAPLIAPSGHRIGALAVNDRVARSLTESQQEALRALSRQAIDQFELRRALTQSRQEALTDALTALGNRRRLLIELGAELERATLAQPITLSGSWAPRPPCSVSPRSYARPHECCDDSVTLDRRPLRARKKAA